MWSLGWEGETSDVVPGIGGWNRYMVPEAEGT